MYWTFYVYAVYDLNTYIIHLRDVERIDFNILSVLENIIQHYYFKIFTAIKFSHYVFIKMIMHHFFFSQLLFN